MRQSWPAALCAMLLLAAASALLFACEKPAGMVRVPGGTYTMGCSPGDTQCSELEEPPRKVKVNSFWMDAKVVTQAQFERAMGANPSRFAGCADCPVDSVTWDEAADYCAKLGKRLPTEAEWERAARGGTTGSRYGELKEIAWYKYNSGGKTRPVGGKQPNAYKLYDMLGNVYEWCADWYERTYRSTDVVDNPKGPASGTARVLRGGSWLTRPESVRASYRGRTAADIRSDSYGFRCVRD
jgi:formylglycine-generating enzyme required for sulfatase activity